MKHVKNCVHEHITIRNGQIIYEKWLYAQADFACSSCKNSRDVVFMRVDPLNVVIRSCEFCGTTERVVPRHPTSNAPIAILLENYAITVDQARAFVKRNRMKIKFMLGPLGNLIKTKPRRTTDISGLEGLEEEE